MNYNREIVYIATVEDSDCPSMKLMVRIDVPGVLLRGVVLHEETRSEDQMVNAAVDAGFELTYCTFLSYIGKSKRAMISSG